MNIDTSAKSMPRDPWIDPPEASPGDPTWGVAVYFPGQGEWTEEEYLALDSQGGRLVELVDGHLEFPTMPGPDHQRILRYLLHKLDVFLTTENLGEVFPAPFPVRLRKDLCREPDLVVLLNGRLRPGQKTPQGADLVVEIISPGSKNRDRDLKKKRREYAKARISEYWIVDPEEQKIVVLTLKGSRYHEHGEFVPGEFASSLLFEGLNVSVTNALSGKDLK